MSACFFSLFLTFTDLNTQILSAHSGEIGRKIQIFTQIPLGVYLYLICSVAYTVAAYLSYNFDLDAIWYNIQSTFSNRFKGGIHPPYNKVTRDKMVEMVQPSQFMVYPLSQHIGAPCVPLVKVGDFVCIGQKIAESDAFVSAPIHATVSGKIAKIELRPHPTMNEVMSIVVENDFEDRMDPTLTEIQRDYTQLSAEEMIEYIRQSGIVGMGGAAFPTHVKLRSALGKVDTVIINAAECEPYLSSDHRVLLENTAEFVEGVKILRQILGVRRVCVGIESNKPDAISALHRALRKTRIKVVVLATKYPQGGEKQLIKSITGREIPSGKLPADVGCCVFNVDTAIAVYRAVVKGYPLMRRIVTVAGDAVGRSGNANVRIGTSIQSVLQHFELNENKLRKLIMGGPMMGNCVCDLDAPIVKGTSGLLCFSETQIVEDCDEHTCIRCGRCITVCPMRLAPNYLRLYTVKDELEKCAKLGAMDCIECGCCSYTCPAKLPLLQYIRIAKQRIKDQSVPKV
ncbi:MAG: electron transport complex subunit RsxC [Clostridia bacterium]|nr:electron transport complex subunit RsxC [Clostridia bacterium]